MPRKKPAPTAAPTQPATAAAPATAPSAAPPAAPVGQWITDLQSPEPAQRQAAAQALQQQAEREPDNALVQQGLGIAHAMAGRLDLGREHFERAVALQPRFATAWSNLGNIHKLQGRLKEARQAYDKAIALQPDLADAHYNLALVDEAEERPEQAEASLHRALLFRPGYPQVHNNLGHLQLKAGKVGQAVSHFRQALVFDPQLEPARHNLILALYRLGRDQEAQAEVDRLLEQRPGDPQVLRLQAAGLAQQGRLEQAEAINRQLLELQPDAPDLRWNLAEVMLQRGDYAAALAGYRELLLQRQVPAALGLGAMGQALLAQGQYSEARDLYQQALAADGQNPALLQGLARSLLAAGELRQGLQVLGHALALQPKAAPLHSQYLLALRLDEQCSPTEHTQEAQRWQQAHAPVIAPRPPLPQRQPGSALRLGLLVGDLEKDPAQHQQHRALMALLAALAAQPAEVFIYHAGPAGTAAQALQGVAPHWRPVASLGDADLVQQMREDGLELLLDLIGHGPNGRLPALAERVAPRQWGWMAQASAASLALWDAAPGLAPVKPPAKTKTKASPKTRPASAAGASLEGSASRLTPWLWAAPEDAPAVSPLPLLQQGQATLGVLAPLAQLQPQLLDTWAALLLAEPDSRLLVLSDAAEADSASRQRLQRLLLLREVEPERVEILPRLDSAATWQALARMDVVLDSAPLPMPAPALLQCLWMGLPVLTLTGPQPWQQINPLLLASVGLAHCSCQGSADYIQQARQLLGQPARLAALRAQLRGRLQAAPCMDPEAAALAIIFDSTSP